MSKRLAVWGAGLIVSLLLIAAAVWLLRPPRLGAVVIEVAGPAGTRFRGSCDEDGHRRDLSGAAPAKFKLQGHRVVYSFTPAESTGQFSVNFVLDGLGSGSVSTGSPPKGVHGWVRFGPYSPSYWIEGFDPESPERWMMPPP